MPNDKAFKIICEALFDLESDDDRSRVMHAVRIVTGIDPVTITFVSGPGARRGPRKVSVCSVCGESGHNAATCRERSLRMQVGGKHPIEIRG